MTKDEVTDVTDSMDNDEAIQEKVDNAEMDNGEAGFMQGYNADIEPDTSDEEGLDDDEKVEN